MTQKTGTLHRMRTSGWFDILIAVLVLALVIGAAALIGQISYLVAAKGYTEDMGQYERTQALNWFARSRSSFGVIAGILGLFSLIGLLLLWLFIWFLGGAIPGVIRGACRLGRKLCYREVPV